MEEGALAPLHHRFRIKIVAAGELLDRSLRSLYSSSDVVRGLGAAVKNLSHKASRNAASAWLIPRHSGTAHLGRVLINRGPTDRGAFDVRYAPDSSEKADSPCFAS